MAQDDDLNKPGGQKRPGRPNVLDLEATEVKAEENAAVAEGSPDEGGASNTETTADTVPPAGDTDATASPQSRPDATASANAAEPASEGHGHGYADDHFGHGEEWTTLGYESREDRLRRWARGGIAVLLLIAGLLSGILVYRNWGSEYFPTPETSEMLARLPALEQASRENRNRLDAFSETVESLKSRISTAEEGLNALRQELGNLRPAVDDARNVAQRAASAVTELREQGGPTASEENIAPLREQVESTAARLQTVESELGMLREAAGSRAATPDEPAQDLTPLLQRLDALEAELAARQEAERQQAAERAQAAASVSASVEALRANFTAGEPFRAELDALRTSLGDFPELEQLVEHAETGLPTRAKLVQEFAAIRGNLDDASAEPSPAATSSAWDALIERLKSVVRIRPAGQDDWAEITNQMAPRVEAGDLNGALRIAETARTAPPAPLADWVALVRDRIKAEDALSVVTARALDQAQPASNR